RLLATAERVREGQTLADALAPVRGLHPLLLRMLQLGERTGNLDQTLAQAAAFYAVEIPRGVKRALQILEPCIVVVAGGTVAFIVLATIMPIFSMYDSIG
ncbi:MAG TPA: type II secretion system F family protein, partial [Planctomycetota bacterium]|nr:type II secretion system F family protein [Planctomycetota bacterium]